LRPYPIPTLFPYTTLFRSCPDRVMTAHGEIAAGLYEYHTVIRFRTQRREQYCPAHDIVAARRVHKELPDMIMVLFHVEHLFLDRITGERRHPRQHGTGRIAARMRIQCYKLFAVLVHACNSLNLLISSGLMSSSSVSVTIWETQSPVIADNPMPSPSCPAAI